MADVRLLTGEKVHPEGSHLDKWTYTASVDGRVGLVTRCFPEGTSRENVERALVNLLAENPGELDGATSTATGGDGQPGDDAKGDEEKPDDGKGDGDEADGDEKGDGDGKDGEVESSSGTGDDRGDGLGDDDGRVQQLAAAVSRALVARGVHVPGDEGDGDGTGRRDEERLTSLVASALHSGTSRTPTEGLGTDVGGMDPERVATLVAGALERAGVRPGPDDSGDGDGTGHPSRSPTSEPS